MPEVTLIPKKEEKKFKLSIPKLIFYIAVALLLLAIFIFLGFYLYNSMLNKSIASLEQEIKLIESQRDIEKDKKFIEEVFGLSNRVKNLKNILDAHVYSSNIFSFFEDLTLPKTRYYNFSVSFPNATFSVRGETDGYIGLVKQMIVVSQKPGVKMAKFSSIELSPGGKVTFAMDLTFDKEVILKKSEK